MKHRLNDQGFTLLEVLASIVILSIVIVSFMTLFPQMSLFNEKTDENLEAVTIAKELLVEMKSQKYTDIEHIPPIGLETNDVLSNDHSFVLSGIYREKYIVISIKREQEFYNGSALNRHEMKINVFNGSDRNILLSTIYGFIRH